MQRKASCFKSEQKFSYAKIAFPFMEQKIIFFYRKEVFKMDEEIRDLLSEEIKNQIQNLSNLPSGSKEKSEAVEAIAKLYKLKIEENRNEQELAIEDEKAEQSLELEEAKLSEQVKDRYFKLGIAAAEIVLPLVFYAAWMRKGFKFEETGTFTSTTFRGLFNRFRPTK